MPTLEAQLTALTQEFVARLVDVIRNASFAEVAALSPPRGTPARAARGARAPQARPEAGASTNGRQTAAKRAEIADRVLRALESASQPLGVRAIANELGLAPDLLAVPLRELRSAGRIRKHGEKRSTTYSSG